MFFKYACVLKIIVLFLNNLILFTVASNSLGSKVLILPLWSWECINEKCVPSRSLNTHIKLQSLETCNVFCSGALLWPLPTGQVNLASAAVPVRADFFQMEVELAPTNIIRQYLSDTFQLFKQDLRKMEGNILNYGQTHSVIIRITVKDSETPHMRLDTDESYKISVKSVNLSSLLAEITAPSFCGARHALETLSQLVWVDHYLDSLLMIQEAVIIDKPKFGYRGLMIDTARNYVPFTELLHTVDAMATSKLNTLHWHASDSQAFTLLFDNVSELARYGAYSQLDIYTSDEVKALVRRARLRGIRVIIEIDLPEHVSPSWSFAFNNHNNIVQCADSKSLTLSSHCNNPPCCQLSLDNGNGLPFIFEVLHNIYSEIILLTGVDDIFHLGGDDVCQSCWAKHFNGSDPMAVWQKYVISALEHLAHVNGKWPNLTLFWSSRFCERIKTDFKDLKHLMGVQVRTATWAEKHVSGIRSIVSHEDAWDLNSGYGTWHGDIRKAPFNSWQRFYEHRPWVKTGRSYIVGGEATLWSWTVGEEGLDAHLWPRVAALAERLWTDHAEGVTRNVYARLDVHRTRLAARGVHSSPIWSYWCTQNPFTCN